MFLAVVNKGNCFLVLIDTVNGHAHFVSACLRTQDGNVIDCFPVPVMDIEAIRFRTSNSGNAS
jgi:hypothetical protein